MIGLYIVNTKENGIRYFAIGEKDEHGKFTGIIHDYTGGGNWEEELVFKDQFLPQYYKDKNPVEWDDKVEFFDIVSNYTVEELETPLYKMCEYNTIHSNYFVMDEFLDKFTDNVYINNTNLNTPYGLGNTSFIDGYEIDEQKLNFEEFKKKIFKEKV